MNATYILEFSGTWTIILYMYLLKREELKFICKLIWNAISIVSVFVRSKRWKLCSASLNSAQHFHLNFSYMLLGIYIYMLLKRETFHTYTYIYICTICTYVVYTLYSGISSYVSLQEMYYMIAQLSFSYMHKRGRYRMSFSIYM